MPEENKRPWAAPEDDERLWVRSERLNRRTCPSESCGVVGRLFFREGVTGHEERNGWARITQTYWPEPQASSTSRRDLRFGLTGLCGQFFHRSLLSKFLARQVSERRMRSVGVVVLLPVFRR